jgi:hypothetical protein
MRNNHWIASWLATNVKELPSPLLLLVPAQTKKTEIYYLLPARSRKSHSTTMQETLSTRISRYEQVGSLRRDSLR